MNAEMEKLIEQWLEGSLDDAKQDELVAWLKDHPEYMKQFVEANVREQMLRDVARGELVAGEVQEIAPIPVETARRIPTRIVAYAAGVAACLLIAVMWFLTNESGVEQTQPFAIVALVSDGNGELKVGDRLGAEAIEIKSGFVRLLFDDGVEVTLQGPAEYDLIAPGKTRLTSGLLTATVPEGAEGFQVETPTARVTDLGTAFGIELDENGDANVSVFEGEVDVVHRDLNEKRLLKEGESVRVALGRNIEQVEIDPEPYEKIWPVSSGIVKSTEAFSIVPPWPRQLRFVHSDHDIFIAPEGYGHTLRRSLRVNISSVGQYSSEDKLTPSEIAVGQRVRSFMMFFHPEKDVPRRFVKEVTGSITFDSPVLGLIVLEDELQATARRFARFGPRDIRRNQQLELTGEADSDVVTLSEDRRTITLKLTTPTRFGEFLRVIVDASQQTSQDTND